MTQCQAPARLNSSDMVLTLKHGRQWCAGCEFLLRRLLGHGTFLLQGNYGGRTALMLAVEKDNAPLVRALLEAGADLLTKDDVGAETAGRWGLLLVLLHLSTCAPPPAGRLLSPISRCCARLRLHNFNHP